MLNSLPRVNNQNLNPQHAAADPALTRCCSPRIKFILASAAVCLICTLASGQNNLVLQWDKSTSTNVVGYNVYYGVQSGNYTNFVRAGNVSTCTISNLAAGATYYFAATAYDPNGIESDFSNEVSWGSNTRPTITSIPDRMINVSESTPALSFTIGDAQTAATELRLTRRSSNTALVTTSGIVFGGTGTSRTVKVTPVSGQVGTSTITVEVSDGSLSSSTSFVLTVNPHPQVSLTAPTIATFTSPTNIRLTAAVVTNKNLIASVRFYRGSTLLGSDSSPPYVYTWSSAPVGTHNLSARVVYNGTKTRTSSSKTVDVLAPGAVQLSASSATLTAPFQLSGGMISQSVSSGVANGGRALFTFTTPAPTNYIINADVLGTSSTANSFFVNINAEPSDPFMVWDFPTSSSVTKRTVSWRGGGTEVTNQYVPKIFSLPAGTHRLVIRGREANAKLGTVTLTPVTGLVAPWRMQTVGSSLSPGVAHVSGGEIHAFGSGMLGGTTDRFAFLYQTLSGDGEIRAKLLGLESTSSAARVGVMIRESLTPDAKHATISKGGDGVLRWQRRQATAASALTSQSSSSSTWLRIQRQGNVLISGISPDGTTWTSMGRSTNVMAANIYVGIISASGTTNRIQGAAFNNVRVVP